jgi:hypothetical protein
LIMGKPDALLGLVFAEPGWWWSPDTVRQLNSMLRA